MSEGRREINCPRREGRITAVVFSHNEAELLPACLDRLRDFDELLVCDVESTDDTVDVASRYRARVLPVPFAPVVEAVRQVALDAVETEWTLFVDPDELVPTGFRSSLSLNTIPPDVAAVRLRYDNTAFGVGLAHVLQGSAKYSLLRSDLAHYDRGTAHMPPTFAGPAIEAPASVPPILHHNFRSVHQSIEKTLRYAQSDPHGARLFADPFRLPREIARDVLAGAWRDGRAGVVLVTINAIGRFYAASLEWEQQGYEDPGLGRGTRWLIHVVDGLRRLRLRLARRPGVEERAVE